MNTLYVTERETGEAVLDRMRESATAPDPKRSGPEGHAVLSEAREFIARFWAAPDPCALDVMTLWAAHAHVTDKDGKLAFYSTPRLAFVSDEPGSGKTAALELLGLLCPRFALVTDPTAPALLQLIAEQRITGGIDELDLLFGSGQAAKAVRNVLNSGYRRGAQIPRVKGPQDCFAAFALAGLASSFMGNPTLGPTRTRSIIIHCRKPAPGVRVTRYREQLHAGLGSLIGESLARWAAGNLLDITTAWPEMPEGLDGRQEDVWMPLLAVADVAGGEWPGRARAACIAHTLGARDTGTELPPRLRLLRDIRRVWGPADFIAAADLAPALAALPGAPWGALWSPLAMTREIPAMLGIVPLRLTDGERGAQGFSRSQFASLFAEIPEEEK